MLFYSFDLWIYVLVWSLFSVPSSVVSVFDTDTDFNTSRASDYINKLIWTLKIACYVLCGNVLYLIFISRHCKSFNPVQWQHLCTFHSPPKSEASVQRSKKCTVTFSFISVLSLQLWRRTAQRSCSLFWWAVAPKSQRSPSCVWLPSRDSCPMRWYLRWGPWASLTFEMLAYTYSTLRLMFWVKICAHEKQRLAYYKPRA